jgi:type VI secretion system protein ImpK
MSADSSLHGPSRDPLGAALAPLFQLLVRMELRRETRNDADKLYRQCCREVETFQAHARDSDLAPQEVELASYALIALIDERAVNQAGALKEYWQPRLLQVRYLSENNAGEGFFERLASVRGHAKRVAVLRVYYLCLLFGFRGKYHLRGSELELLEVTEGVRGELERMHAVPKEIVLSPSGRRPYERIADTQQNQLLLGLAAVAAVISLLLYVGLRLALVRETELLVERVTRVLGV